MVIELTKTYKIESLKQEDQGIIQGYATTYGNIDEEGDIIARGAFSDWLKSENKVPFIYGHDFSKIENILGEATLFDSERGVKFNAKVDFDLPNGKTSYKLMKSGLLDSVSIRFLSDSFEFNKDGNRVFNKGEIKELSLVPFPANPKALISAVKSINRGEITSIRHFENFLSDSGFSKSEACKLASGGWKAILRSDSEEIKSLKAQIEENTKLIKGIIK